MKNDPEIVMRNLRVPIQLAACSTDKEGFGNFSSGRNITNDEMSSTNTMAIKTRSQMNRTHLGNYANAGSKKDS